jgi:lysophospholipase L1-like esterase
MPTLFNAMNVGLKNAWMGFCCFCLSLATPVLGQTAPQIPEGCVHLLKTPPPISAVPTPHDLDKDFYRRFTNLQEQLAGASPEIAVFGDSFVQVWPDRQFDEAFPSGKAMRLGVGGDQTQHLLWRIDHGNFPSTEPATIVLLIGTNNINARQSAEIAANGVASIVVRLRQKAPNARILVVGILPRGESAASPDRIAARDTNALLAKCQDGTKIRFIDPSSSFLMPDGSLVPNMIIWDHIHLGTRGYDKLAEAIAAELRNWMPN